VQAKLASGTVKLAVFGVISGSAADARYLVIWKPILRIGVEFEE
jgi:hypothetical protein